MKSSSYLLLSIVLFFGSIILFIFFLHYHHKKDVSTHKKDVSTYENLPEEVKENSYFLIGNYVNNYCKVEYNRNSFASTTINLKPHSIYQINDIKVFGELGWSNAKIKWINKYTFKTSDELTQIDSISMIFNDSTITLKSSIGGSFVKYFMNENDINNFYSGVLSDYNSYNSNNGINKKMLLFSAIIFFILGLLFFIVQVKVQNKEIENDRKVKVNRINAMKRLYKSTKIPIMVDNTMLRWTQNQTRQILTGALTYAQPKEYSLYINCTNIFDKDIVAIEFDIKTLNAFNEQISSFVVSTKKQLSFGESTECVWNLSGSFDINNTVTEVKRVMFSDGTIWNK